MDNLYTIKSEEIIGFTKTEEHLMFWISLDEYIPIEAYEGQDSRHFVVEYNNKHKQWSINLSEWDGYSFLEECDDEFDMEQVQVVCESIDLNELADHTEYYHEYWEEWGE